MLGRSLLLKSLEFIVTPVLKMCEGNTYWETTSLQALSSKESSGQKECEDAVKPELTDKEKRRIEDEQLKQKAVIEKDLVSCNF